ncbi:RES family NAD+ phosphorylase [Salinibacter altiplanensis]|uniref:RES family NAD+ phosphorylase n=1 Tax=Salinibacter altiplanensis TaxID=1803181 RepID=UPI000C9EE2D4|nr:RES family NAD+ phosphorylase [Salinibacter altiplanensis]
MGKTAAWRITSEKYVGTALSGEGAEEYGGRFNSVGLPIVYTSESISLATLELLAKAGGRQRLSGCVVLPVTFEENQVIAYDEEDLPGSWDDRPYGPASQQVSDEWIRSEESLVLRVPSVVVPEEHNYLINPEHSEFEELEIGEPRPLDVDPRLPAE